MELLHFQVITAKDTAGSPTLALWAHLQPVQVDSLLFIGLMLYHSRLTQLKTARTVYAHLPSRQILKYKTDMMISATVIIHTTIKYLDPVNQSILITTKTLHSWSVRSLTIISCRVWLTSVLFPSCVLSLSCFVLFFVLGEKTEKKGLPQTVYVSLGRQTVSAFYGEGKERAESVPTDLWYVQITECDLANFMYQKDRLPVAWLDRPGNLLLCNDVIMIALPLLGLSDSIVGGGRGKCWMTPTHTHQSWHPWTLVCLMDYYRKSHSESQQVKSNMVRMYAFPPPHSL